MKNKSPKGNKAKRIKSDIGAHQKVPYVPGKDLAKRSQRKI